MRRWGKLELQCQRGGGCSTDVRPLYKSKQEVEGSEDPAAEKGGRKGENPSLQTRYKGSDGDKKVSKIHRVPYQKTSIPEVSVG